MGGGGFEVDRANPTSLFRMLHRVKSLPKLCVPRRDTVGTCILQRPLQFGNHGNTVVAWVEAPEVAGLQGLPETGSDQPWLKKRKKSMEVVTDVSVE